MRARAAAAPGVMDVTQVPHTFVRTVKAQDLCFNQVDDVLERVRAGGTPAWVILGFAVRSLRVVVRLAMLK